MDGHLRLVGWHLDVKLLVVNAMPGKAKRKEPGTNQHRAYYLMEKEDGTHSHVQQERGGTYGYCRAGCFSRRGTLQNVVARGKKVTRANAYLYINIHIYINIYI